MSRNSVSLAAPSQEDEVIQAFKGAMRRFAVSVSIITIANGAAKAGMTATAVSSMSMSPPSLLVCINRSARMHAEMHVGRAFCVNILNTDQAAVSSAFGGRLPAEERFSEGAWSASSVGVPYLSNAQVNVFCTVDATFDYGSHTIFIGKVESVRLNGKCRPLVYADGKYVSIADIESTENVPDLIWL